MNQGEASTKHQHYSAFCVNILTFSYACFAGWPSASFLILQSELSPLKSGPIDNNEVSWIGSVLCLGGLVGNFVFGWLSKTFGTKTTLLAAAVPLLSSWFFVITAENVTDLCLARFLGGMSGSGSFAILPIYITEIADDRIRGTLGSYLNLSFCFGILVAFLCGNYLSYQVIPYVLSIPCLIFVILFGLLPATPHYLLQNNKVYKAKKSYKFYKNLKGLPLEGETELLRQFGNVENVEECNNSALSWSDFTNKAARKAIIISLVLMALSQFCGVNPMLNYTASIFQSSGSSLSPNMSAIVVGVIQILGAIMATLLVEKAGRKILLIVSALGCFLGLTCLAIYSLLNYQNVDTTGYEWIPIASFSFVIFIGSIGVVAIHFIVMSEITPPKIINIISPLSIAVLFITGFITLMAWPLFTEAYGLHSTMSFFGVCSLLGALFVIFCVPETKGKSFSEISLILNK